MIRNLIIYSIWVFISGLFLKSGIEFIIDKRIPWSSVVLITIYLHIAVVLPVSSAINVAVGRRNENS